MLKRILFVSSLVFVSASASADDYTRRELEQKSKSELIDIILRLQGGGSGGGCKTFDPLAGETGTLFRLVQNPGYSNDGTLKWPNGEVFLVRNRGYNNDQTLGYPNGNKMVLRNSGYGNDNTIFWPNGNKMRYVNSGYSNDGTIYRADESMWLRRNRGYSNDLERIGLPFENFSVDGFEVRARLTDDHSVDSVTYVQGDGWSIEVTLHGGDNSVSVTECY